MNSSVTFWNKIIAVYTLQYQATLLQSMNNNLLVYPRHITEICEESKQNA